jgi:hypothetical protein
MQLVQRLSSYGQSILSIIISITDDDENKKNGDISLSLEIPVLYHIHYSAGHSNCMLRSCLSSSSSYALSLTSLISSA